MRAQTFVQPILCADNMLARVQKILKDERCNSILVCKKNMQTHATFHKGYINAMAMFGAKRMF